MRQHSILEKENDFKIEDFMLVQRVIKKINSILNLNELLEQIIEDASKLWDSQNVVHYYMMKLQIN